MGRRRKTPKYAKRIKPIAQAVSISRRGTPHIGRRDDALRRAEEEIRELKAARSRDEKLAEAADVLYYASLYILSNEKNGEVDEEVYMRARRLVNRARKLSGAKLNEIHTALHAKYRSRVEHGKDEERELREIRRALRRRRRRPW